jgi:hypothetical protein
MTGRLATGTLASRGARNPDALAAFIAGRTHSGGRTISLAGGASADNQGDSMTCPQCGYSGGRGDFGGDGDNDGDGSEALRTPAPSTGFVREGAPLTVRGASAGAGLSNPGGGVDVELAAPRYPVTGAADLLIARSPAGGASVRHRRGGGHIGDITYSDDKGWQAVYGGKAGRSHAHQRPALAELVSTWNTGTASLQRPGADGAPLQPPPTQTPLMQQYGVPAIRALATPVASSSAGPRITTSSAGSDNDDDDKGSGLSGKAASVYAKLVARGWDKAKARKFAANASRFGGSGS